MRSVTLGSSLDRVLHQLATSARQLVGARYPAIGVPEAEGDEFAQFVTVGMSDELVAQLGPLPRHPRAARRHALDPRPTAPPTSPRSPPAAGGPRPIPARSFLGVPIVSAGDVIGAFYLTDKQGAGGFTARDEAAVVLLAFYAAIAIDQARLFEDSRELALVQERGRLARELHDAMSQSLFSLQLSAEAATRLLPGDPEAAAAALATVRALAAQVSAELRTTVEGLRPADLERDRLAATLVNQLTVAGRAHDVPVELEVGRGRRLDPEVEHQVLRIAQEAVTNALRHAGRPGDGQPRPGRLRGWVLRVADDGVGFDPEAGLQPVAWA